MSDFERLAVLFGLLLSKVFIALYTLTQKIEWVVQASVLFFSSFAFSHNENLKD